MSGNDKPALKPFNPLDKRNLGESVADALLQTTVASLPPEPFIGAGVYAIYKRLTEHAESINAVQNLGIADFFCRFLVVDDIWIPLAESMLIERFKPIWNRILDGFGNHDPGKGRYQGMMP